MERGEGEGEGEGKGEAIENVSACRKVSPEKYFFLATVHGCRRQTVVVAVISSKFRWRIWIPHVVTKLGVKFRSVSTMLKIPPVVAVWTAAAAGERGGAELISVVFKKEKIQIGRNLVFMVMS